LGPVKTRRLSTGSAKRVNVGDTSRVGTLENQTLIKSGARAYEEPRACDPRRRAQAIFWGRRSVWACIRPDADRIIGAEATEVAP
jgi:hypothetical protein